MICLQAPLAGSAGERSRTGIVERLAIVGAFGLALLYSLLKLPKAEEVKPKTITVRAR